MNVPLKFRPMFVLVVMLSLVLGACSTSTPTTAPAASTESAEAGSETAQGGSIVIGLATEPVSLDPAAGLYIAEQYILNAIFDPLIWVDGEETLQPGLAASWEQNGAGTEFTLHLREDVKFHDGTAFNADAVKFAIDRAATGANPAAVAPTLLTDYVGTDVVDPYTVTVKFNTPKANFLQDLSRIWMTVPSPAAVEKYGEDFGQNPVGTGPFIFKEWAAQDHLTVTRNPDYNWGPAFASHTGPALLAEITFRFLPEAATRLTAFESGEAQVVEDPAYQQAAALADNPAYKLERFTAPGMASHMMINTDKAPTDDIRVRQALIYAVNQEELVKTAFFDMQTAAHSVLSPTTWAYNEQAASVYSYDPDQAAALLDKAGWVDSDGDGIREKDGVTLHIEYPALPAYEEAYMELLAAYLNKAGFDVTITKLDDAGISAFGAENKHNILNMGWISRDPSVLNITYNSANIENGSAYSRFKNEELDTALNEAQQTLDPEKRKDLYITVQRIIMENALVIPLHTYDRVNLLQADVQGWHFDPEGFPYLYEVSLGS